MKSETARWIEEKTNRPPGYLDTPIPDDAAAEPLRAEQPSVAYPVKPHHERALVQTVCELAEQIDDNGLRELVGFARCLTGTHPLIKTKRQSSA